MKKLKLFAIITLLIFSFIPITEAANWTLIDETGIELVFIDTDSITAEKDGARDIWVKNHKKQPNCSPEIVNSFGKCISYTLGYYRYFNNKSLCSIQATAYFVDGTNYSTQLQCENTLRKIVPDSQGEVIWKRLFINAKGTE